MYPKDETFKQRLERWEKLTWQRKSLGVFSKMGTVCGKLYLSKGKREHGMFKKQKQLGRKDRIKIQKNKQLHYFLLADLK